MLVIRRFLKRGFVCCTLFWLLNSLLRHSGGWNGSKETQEADSHITDVLPSDYMAKPTAIDKVEPHSKEDDLSTYRKVLYETSRPNDDKYAINETRSQMLSVMREIPDTRPPECSNKHYNLSSLPTMSVVIPMYNEAPSILLRTIHSILSRTPPSLLADIVVVDDMSTNENMRQPLTDYVALLPPVVRILRLKKKAHLIRARMAGASIAKGDVLLFQDGHTEVNVGWAEPVLDYISRHRNTIIQPAVDDIDQWSIEYEPASSTNHKAKWRGVFLWDMRYAWQRTPAYYKSWLSSDASPYPCPVLVGCSIAVNRAYFYEIGGFDVGLDIWGGEQIELSFRAWMCGGRVVIHPCSRIGHIFKPWMKSDVNWKKREQAIAKNNIRVGESWMESYATYYYASNRIYDFKRVDLSEGEKAGILERRRMATSMNCKSFRWYLDNVLPELTAPHVDSRFYGEVGNAKSSLCLTATSDGYVGLTSDCYLYSRFQEHGEFSFRASGHLMYKTQCVMMNEVELLQLVSCEKLPPQHGKISFKQTGGLLTRGIIIYELPGHTDRCLEQVTNILPVHKNEQMPQFRLCSDTMFQQWDSNYHFEYELVPPPLFTGDVRIGANVSVNS